MKTPRSFTKDTSGRIALHDGTEIQTYKISDDDYKEALRIGIEELIRQGKMKLADIIF